MAGTREDMQDMYAERARWHSGVTFERRCGLDAVHVRYVNNFVKACVIDAAARTGSPVVPLTVVDAACGRGQDHAKWMYGAGTAGRTLAAYHGFDLVEEDVEAARVKAARYLARVPLVALYQLDMGCQPWASVATGSATVVSCQLALHYLWDAEAHVVHFLAEVRRALVPRGGLVLLSFTDGRAVVRRAREGALVARYHTLEVPAATAAPGLPSPFGQPYRFTLPDSVEATTEYLCHEGKLRAMASAVGLPHVALSAYFDVLACRLVRLPRFQALAAKMRRDLEADLNPAALDTANLYRMLVLCSDAPTAAAFQKALCV